MLPTYPSDHNIIFISDASMSPYESARQGGSVEHWNEESGGVWIERMAEIYEHRMAQLSPSISGPTRRRSADRQFLGGRMYTLRWRAFDGP